MGDEQQGLAGALEQTPDFSAQPPQTPEELEQRKGQWRGLLGQIQSDPNIMRAVAVMGIRMMQPGATFGQGVAAGFGAYEGGRAAQMEWERQQAIDAQNAAMNDVRMRGMQQEQSQKAQMFPGELDLQRGKVGMIPAEQQKARAAGQQAELETRLQESGAQTRLDSEKQRLENMRRQGALLGAQTEHQRQLGSQAQKKTSAEVQQEQYDRDMSMYMNVVKKANPAWDDSQVFVEAQRQYNASRYGQPAQIKQQSAEDQAIADSIARENTPPANLIMWSDARQRSADFGDQLREKQGNKPTGSNDSGVKKIGQAVVFERDANGKIVRKQ